MFFWIGIMKGGEKSCYLCINHNNFSIIMRNAMRTKVEELFVRESCNRTTMARLNIIAMDIKNGSSTNMSS